LVNRLLVKYEKQVEKAPVGKRFQDCFDLRTNKPSEEYHRLYQEVKTELEGIGIPLG
jgi:methylamine--corrinoid protein Co-methyltransferase